MKDSWNFDKKPLKFSWNSPWNLLKRLESPVKHSWNTLEISLWHPWNFLKTPQKFFETPSKFPYTSITPWKLNLNSAKTSLNHPQNFFEPPLKLPQSTLKLLKLSRNNLETSLQHPWNFLETKLHRNTHKTPLKLPWNILWPSSDMKKITLGSRGTILIICMIPKIPQRKLYGFEVGWQNSNWGGTQLWS